MTTYTAWDGNEYPLPTPQGWYLGADERWWPDGHGPGPAALSGLPSSGLPSTGLPSAAPPGGNSPGWTSAPETTVFSSPPPGSGAATASPIQPSGGGGKGKVFLAIGAVLVGLAAIGGAAFVLLGSSDDEEETAVASTLVSAEQDELDDAPATTVAGDEPAATVSVVPGKGSVEDPYAIGEDIVVQYTDGTSGELRTWTVEVLGSSSDITEAVLAENQFNDEPVGDQLFAGVPIRVTYVSGPAPASLFELTFKAIGPSGVELTTFDPSCGVIPNALDTFEEVFEGGSVEGNVCWSASPADADDLTMLIEVFLEDTQIYVDLSG